MNKGPVKVDFGKEAKPISEKQKAIDELNERNLKLIQRSLVLGTVIAGAGCYAGWLITKWIYSFLIPKYIYKPGHFQFFQIFWTQTGPRDPSGCVGIAEISLGACSK